MISGLFSVTSSQPPVRWDLAVPQENDVAAPRAAFLGGEENQLVGHSLDRLLGEGTLPGDSLLVYHGPTGVGKTLLVEALVDAWKQRRPTTQVMTLSAADFARRFSGASQPGEARRQSAELRSCDLFVLEDLQHLAGRGRPEHELRMALDALLDRGAAIVVTANKSPTQLENLDPCLASRLSAGLVIPVQLPGVAARRAILGMLANRFGMNLTAAAANKLAEVSSGNALKLNALLADLHRSLPSATEPIEPETVEKFLQQRQSAHAIDLPMLTRVVCKALGLTATELRSNTRRRPVVRARSLAMLFARRLGNHSLQQIGKYYGGRDHTTVIHACRKAESELKTDPALAETAKKISIQLAAFSSAAAGEA